MSVCGGRWSADGGFNGTSRTIAPACGYVVTMTDPVPPCHCHITSRQPSLSVHSPAADHQLLFAAAAIWAHNDDGLQICTGAALQRISIAAHVVAILWISHEEVTHRRLQTMFVFRRSYENVAQR